ncbi:IS630 family transposase [Consotaella sp. CSK11QG-6]
MWFQDEARVGQKGRLCHRWWTRGKRPPGLCDQRFEWTYIYGAVEPATGRSFALILPFANKEMMSLYLAEFAKTIADEVHVVMVLDGAGWHGKAGLNVPDAITLVPLPAYSPELNPVERLWLYLKETCLSLRFFADQAAIIDACCQAWNRATENLERIISLCNYPWIKAVTS